MGKKTKREEEKEAEVSKEESRQRRMKIAFLLLPAGFSVWSA